MENLEGYVQMSFDDLLDRLPNDDKEIIENYVFQFENKYSESQNRFKYVKKLIAEYFELKNSPLELTSDEQQQLITLEKQLKL